MATRFTGKHAHLLASPRCLVMLSALLFVLSGHGMVYATAFMSHVPPLQNQAQYIPVLPNSAVTTVRNDIQRTGQNLNETVLTTSNVNASTFGRRVTYAVDGQVYAQPLFMPNVLINGRLHNVVYVATEHDSVYAFDADQTNALGGLLWVHKYGSSANSTPVPTDDLFGVYRDIDPEVGITGTPVIDPATGTLYVVTMTREGTAPKYRYVQRLHALDIANGFEKFNGHVEIQASVPGKGAGSVHGRIAFNERIQNQRPGLLLLNGVVYIAWSSFGDRGPYHGWIIGYNAQTLRQVAVYNSTPNGSQAGIWMGGDGLAVDNNGYIYASTGNGTFDLNNKGGKDAGDSVIKLDPRHNLSLVDYFTPFNQSCLGIHDRDLGSSGILLFPPQISGNTIRNNLFVEGKEGRGYLLARNHMGGYANDRTLVCGKAREARTNVDHIVQEFPVRTIPPIFGSAAFYTGTATSGPYMYVGGINAPLQAYRYNQHNDGKLATTPSSKGNVNFNYPGASPVVSANGSLPGTGIVWVISRRCSTAPCPSSPNGVLRAYDATNLNKLLYTSDENFVRDYLSNFVKFSAPTIANGRVFVGDGNSLKIYGLLSDS